MRILLLNPPFKNGRFSRTSRSPAITRSGTLYYPIWLAYAAGVLEKDGFDVKMVDSPAAGLSALESVNIAAEFKPNLVVIDTSTPSIYSDIETGRLVKEKIKDSFLILVGTHPTALPEETLVLNGSIDAVAVGEYDYTVRDLARALEGNKGPVQVPGVVYRDGERVVRNDKRPLIEDLDGLPFVSSVYKKHLNIKDYFFAASYHPFVMIMTGRGCPFNCSFCLYPQVFHSGKYRLRSPENVADEFEYITRELPEVKEVGIEDDTFTADRNRAHKICELLIKRGSKVPWYANVRPDLNYGTMRLMKSAGCRLLIAGFESGSQEILDNIGKEIRLESMARFAEDAKRAGLLVHGCFIFGSPGERLDTMMETLTFAEKLNCDTAQFFPLMVYPGTSAYEWARKEGFLKTGDFSKWVTEEGLHNTVVSTEWLSDEDLLRFCNYARRHFYLRPRYIIYKSLRCLADPKEFMRTLKSFRTFYRHLV